MTATGGPWEFEGEDLDAALAEASRAVGRPVEELAWEVVDEGRKGVFGLGARSVRIRVAESAATPAAEAPAPPPPAPRVVEPSAPSGMVETFRRMIELTGYRADVCAIRHDGGWTLRVDGPDRKQLVKRDGELLEAYEFVLNRMGRRAWPDAGSLRVECDGFRDRRDGELVELARELAGSVARTGRPETIDDLNPYERRLVHITVRELEGIGSRSEGDGFLKCVWIERVER